MDKFLVHGFIRQFQSVGRRNIRARFRDYLLKKTKPQTNVNTKTTCHYLQPPLPPWRLLHPLILANNKIFGESKMLSKTHEQAKQQ